MGQLPVKGQIRYNANTDNWEIHNGLDWYVKVDNARHKHSQWRKWWAWRPVKDIHGQWHWAKTVYRRDFSDVLTRYEKYEYGTLFDVLKEA